MKRDPAWIAKPTDDKADWLLDRVRELQEKTGKLEGKTAATEISLKEALEAIEKLEGEVEELKKTS